MDVGPLYVARLCKSLTHVVSPYSGGVAECILGCNFCYVHAVCWKHLINVQLCVKKNAFSFFSPHFLKKNELFKRLIMPQIIRWGVSFPKWGHFVGVSIVLVLQGLQN